MESSIIGVLIILGSVLMLIAGLGIARLPDSLCRAHALSKAVTLGLSLILIALAVVLDSRLATTKIVLVVIFHVITIPLTGHIFALYVCREMPVKTDQSSGD